MEYQLYQLWPVINIELRKLSFSKIKETLGHPSLDMERFGRYTQASGSSWSTKDELISEIDRQISTLSPSEKESVIRHIAQKLCEKFHQNNQADSIEKLNSNLKNFGWTIHEGNLLPLEVLEPSDLEFVPESSRQNLLRASARIRDGDLSGAITACCGAVDSICNEWGSSNQDSFQKRIKDALDKSGRLDEIQTELGNLSWEANRITEFVSNLKGAINQGALVMQTLRSKMSDVHGNKKVIEPLVFDSIKWAMIICSLLKK